MGRDSSLTANRQPLTAERKELYVKALRGRAEVYNLIGRYGKALKDYKKAEEQSHEITDIAEIKIAIASLFSTGKSDYNEAEALIKSILKVLKKQKNLMIYAKALDALGGIYRRRGDYGSALSCYNDAMKVYKRIKCKRELSSVSNNIGIIYWNMGKLDEAFKYYQKHLKISEEIGNKRGVGVAYGNIGSIYLHKGKLDESFKYYQKYLNVSKDIGDKRGIGIAYGNIGVIFWNKGELGKALGYLEKYLRISEEIGNKRGVGVSSGNIGIIYYRRGKLDKAFKYYQKHLKISEEIGDKRGFGMAYVNIGVVYWDKGELNKAFEYCQKSLNVMEDIGYTQGIGIACIDIAGIYRDMGTFDNALKYLKKAEKIFIKIENKLYLSEVYSGFSELYTKGGDDKKGLDFAQKALSLAEEIGSKEQKIFALRSLGAASARGKKDVPEKTIAYFQKSILLAREEKMQFELGKSLYEFARIANRLPLTADRNSVGGTFQSRLSYGKAKEHLKEAERIFKKIGAKGWLKKVKKIWEEINDSR